MSSCQNSSRSSVRSFPFLSLFLTPPPNENSRLPSRLFHSFFLPSFATTAPSERVRRNVNFTFPTSFGVKSESKSAQHLLIVSLDRPSTVCTILLCRKGLLFCQRHFLQVGQHFLAFRLLRPCCKSIGLRRLDEASRTDFASVTSSLPRRPQS